MPDSNQASRFRLTRTLTALTLTAALVAPFAWAGDGHKKCPADTQKCLNKMSSKMSSKGWLGLETKKAKTGGYHVVAVTPDGPAAQAGFQPGDVLVALNGVKLTSDNKKELKKIKKGLTPGAAANYVVLRDGTKVQLAVTLAQMPESRIAEAVGRHLLDQHSEVKTASLN